MSDMLNRVEAVISEKLMATWSSASPLAEAYMLKLSGILAREVIEAMREPTEAMVKVGVDDILTGPGISAFANWSDLVASRHRMMIDAALKGEAE